MPKKQPFAQVFSSQTHSKCCQFQSVASALGNSAIFISFIFLLVQKVEVKYGQMCKSFLIDEAMF
jgi:hypothetical protein